MNKARRKAITELQEKINGLTVEIESVVADLESLRDEEQDYYSNMPEGIQAGEKGEKAQEAIGNMENSLDVLQTITDEFNEVVESLDSSMEG